MKDDQDSEGSTLPNGSELSAHGDEEPSLDSGEDAGKRPASESPEKQLLESCACRDLIEDLLSTYYVPLETWYLRTIIDKAHRLSVPDASSQPPQTTTPDDVFYILKVILTRLVSTGSLQAVEATCNAIKDIIDRDYAGVIARKLEDVYAGKVQTTGPRAEKAERENRAAFIVCFLVSKFPTTMIAKLKCF